MNRRVDPGAAVMAAAAFVWHMVLMTRAANDNFMHMAMAQQWLGGDWPVRDFFDNGRLLQYSLSALAQLTFGDRLIGEAIVVGLTWAISTYVVFILVRRLTGVVPLAFVASLLLIVSGARGYSYPKGIVYAVAAAVWWAYVRRPALQTIVAFGAWVAVAYYWRPDHGIYAALALTLAALTAHGLRRETVTRVAIAACTTLALVLPFWIYIQSTVGIVNYARAGMTGLESEHESHGTHVWPILRFRGNIVVSEPGEQYAPTVGIRWAADSTPDARQAVRQRYGLTTVEIDGDSERVRLTAESVDAVAALVREPIVEDTAGIDRSGGRLEPSRWPLARRLRFEHPWLRLQVLPQLDARERATEYTVALFLALPLLVLVASPWVAPRLAADVTPLQVAAFALFAFAVSFAMLREPFTARAADAVVLCAVMFALCVTWWWRTGQGASRVRMVAGRGAAVALVLVTTTSAAMSGQFGSTLAGLTRPWTNGPVAGLRAVVDPELTASPPLAHYLDRPARITLRLAAYARGCVPPTDRVLVLWFEPEIPYFSERLLAQRHFVFPPPWADLPYEQQATLEKVSKYQPPLAFALRSALDRTARRVYPGLVNEVERDYQLAAHVEEGGEDYLIFARRDRPALGRFGAQGWPCFTQDPSPWDRVGVVAEP